MAIPYRGQTSSSTYFITAGVFCKKNLLQSERMAEMFCRVLYDYRMAGKFLLHAFVVMPNHIHLLLSVPQGLTLERSIQLVKGGFSREAGKLLRLPHPFWQKSFVDRRVRDISEFERFRNYIHENPVRAHLVESAAAYLYSSANPLLLTDALPQRLKPQGNSSLEMHR